MVAIAAVFIRNGEKAPKERIRNISAALRPFGRHAAEAHCGSAALVARSFDANMPFAMQTPVPAADSCRILFDGHLRRRPELLDSLGQVAMAQWTDDRLFAAAWAQWGEAAFDRVDGEFCAVVWNRRLGTLVAGCSPITAPPLYFHVNGTRAVVATTPRAIFAWGDLARRIDDERLSDNLAGYGGLPQRTYHADIRMLLAGEVLAVTAGAVRQRRYYDLASRIRQPAEADHVYAANAALRSAVAEAIPRSGRSPAILLSGGLDSTAVAVVALDVLGLAKEGSEKALVTVTSRPAENWDGRAPRGRVADEAPLVRELAASYPGLAPRFATTGALEPDHELDATIALTELPPRTYNNLLWIRECMRTVEGRSVVLTGESGNATLSWAGDLRLTEMMGGGQRALREVWHEAGGAGRGRRHAMRAIVRGALPLLHPRLGSAALQFTRPRLRMPTPASPIHPQYALSERVRERAQSQGFGPFQPLFRTDVQARLAARCNPLSQSDSRAVVRTIETQTGVSLRDPLGERPLVEWCLGVPSDQFYGLGEGRLLMRRLLRGRVPSAVLNAPRGLQDADWHSRYTRALPRIREMLHDWRTCPSVAERIDLDRLLRLIDTWPAQTPLSKEDHPEFMLAQGGLCQALSVGKFIRWVDQDAPSPTP